MCAELYHTAPVGLSVIAYYHCDLCDTITKQLRDPHAVPDRIRCRYCDNNERNM